MVRFAFVTNGFTAWWFFSLTLNHAPWPKQKSTAELLHEGNPSPAAAPCRNSTKPSPRQTWKAMVIRLGVNFFEFSVFVSFSKCLSSQYLVNGSAHKDLQSDSFPSVNTASGFTWKDTWYPMVSPWVPGHLLRLILCSSRLCELFPWKPFLQILDFPPNKSYQIPTSSFVCSLLWDSTLEPSRNISYRIIHAENTQCPKIQEEVV